MNKKLEQAFEERKELTKLLKEQETRKLSPSYWNGLLLKHREDVWNGKTRKKYNSVYELMIGEKVNPNIINKVLSLSGYSVENLRKHGFKVRVIHQRFIYEKDWECQVDRFRTQLKYFRDANIQYTREIIDLLVGQMDFSMDSNLQNGEVFFESGGKTIIQITAPDKTEHESIANCHIKDNFCYKTGVRIALQKPEMIKMWEIYHNILK